MVKIAKGPSEILQKSQLLKSLRHEDGKFLMWETPCTIDPILFQIYYDKLIGKNCSKEVANRVRYYVAKAQAGWGSELMDQKYGYTKSLKVKRDILDFDRGQTELVGIGKFDLIRADFKNNVYISRTQSPYAEVYKMFFGLQKECVDFWLMGIWAGGIEPIVKEKLACFESSCVAKGDSYCELVIKPLKSWAKDDKLVKKYGYLLTEEPSLKEVGSQFSSLKAAFKQ